MIEEEADAAAFFSGREEDLERPFEAQWPDWAGHIRIAFDHLRDDRHYGAMGGLGRIWFASISDYAARFGINGQDFDDFATFVRAVDDEFIAVMNERAKLEADQRENKP